MRLPIDFSQAHFPIKEKYIDFETRELSTWMVFGAYGDGTVGISDANGDDIFIHVPLRQADLIVAARNAWVNHLVLLLNHVDR